jgi:Zn-finger nucleic acid-binding protein
MRCPICKTPTDLIQYERVPVYNCGSCGGYWVTRAKLEVILARREVQMPEAVQKKMIEIAAASNSTAELCCFTCGTVMERRRFARWPDIQIDVCRRCKNIWLDRGELEKCQIYWERAQDKLRSSRAAEPPKPAKPPPAPHEAKGAARVTQPPPPRPKLPGPAHGRVEVREVEPDPNFLDGRAPSRWGRILGDLFGAA